MNEDKSLIPYFSFSDIPRRNLLLLKIFIDKTKFSDVVFNFNEHYVIVSTAKYKTQRYNAKIHFPIKVLKRDISYNYDNNYNYSKRCYELFLEKYESNRITEGDICNYSKIPTIDIITKHLSWNDTDYQEESHSMDNVIDPENPEKDVENDIITNFRKQLVLCEQQSTKTSTNFFVSSDIKLEVGTYGFAGRYNDELLPLEGNYRNIIDLQNPRDTDIETRLVLREEDERKSFDVEHYLADYFLENNDELCETIPLLFRSIRFDPYWCQINRADEKELSSQEMRILASLHPTYFNLSKLERIEVLHSLFDIILAYAYDYRINFGKHNSESAWNINKLSSTLSWFTVYRNAEVVVTSFLRRSLTYPLLRHWSFSLKVLDDALEIFYLGRRQILNCLVAIFELFEADNERKILNRLYIQDYLIWIQQVHPQTIHNYLSLLYSCKGIKKQDVFAILPGIEQEAIEMFKKGDEYAYNAWRRNVNDLTYLMDNERNEDSHDSSVELKNQKMK